MTGERHARVRNGWNGESGEQAEKKKHQAEPEEAPAGVVL